MNPVTNTANIKNAPLSKKKKTKGPYRTLHVLYVLFGILSILFVLGWLTFFFLYGLLPSSVAGNFSKFIEIWIKPHVYEFLRLLLLKKYGLTPKDSPYFYFTYVGLAIAVFLLVILVLGIVFAIKGHKKLHLLYILVAIFASIALLEFVVYYESLYKDYLVIVFHDLKMMANIIFSWVIFLTAVLSYVTMLFTFLFWLIYVSKTSIKKKEKVAEESPKPIENKESPKPVINKVTSTPTVNKVEPTPVASKATSTPAVNKVALNTVLDKLTAKPIENKEQKPIEKNHK